MTEDGRKGLALLVVRRCEKLPDLSLEDMAFDTYQGVRAMQGSLGFNEPSRPQAKPVAQPDPRPARKIKVGRPCSTADPHRQQYSLNARPIRHILSALCGYPSDSRRAYGYTDLAYSEQAWPYLKGGSSGAKDSGNMASTRFEPRLGDSREIIPLPGCFAHFQDFDGGFDPFFHHQLVDETACPYRYGRRDPWPGSQPLSSTTWIVVDHRIRSR